MVKDSICSQILSSKQARQAKNGKGRILLLQYYMACECPLSRSIHLLSRSPGCCYNSAQVLSGISPAKSPGRGKRENLLCSTLPSLKQANNQTPIRKWETQLPVAATALLPSKMPSRVRAMGLMLWSSPSCPPTPITTPQCCLCPSHQTLPNLLLRSCSGGNATLPLCMLS